jgi:lipopolysaccharide biosynthesis protein
VHLYYPELWTDISKKLSNITVPYDVFVSVQKRDKKIVLGSASEYHGATNIIALPNRGRDVLPFLLIAKKISQEANYEYVLKIHSKKSPHRNDGANWLNSLLSELIPEDNSKIIAKLEKTNTGAIGPASHVVSLSRYMGANKKRIKSILENISDKKTSKDIINAPSKYPFFGGTMFWCRIDFLSPLLNSDITPADFNSEHGQVDGTTAHAIERIFGKALHKVTNKKMYLIKNGIVSELPSKTYFAKYRHVE